MRDADELGSLARAGDEQARDELALRLWPIALNVAGRFFGERRADQYLTRSELAQECLAQFFARIENWDDGRGRIIPYFSGLCVHLGIKARVSANTRKRKKVALPERPGEHAEFRAVDAADGVLAVEGRSRATRRQWRVLRLVHVEGMTHAQAGEVIGATRRQVDEMIARLAANEPYDPKPSGGA